jgi:hypothetical protein
MYDLTCLIISALAVWEAIEIWHHSTLFSGIRGWVEAWDNRLGDLLGCPFCLAPWVALVVICLVNISFLFNRSGGTLSSLIGDIAVVPVVVLAVARLANIGNDLTHRFSRTPAPDEHPWEKQTMISEREAQKFNKD